MTNTRQLRNGASARGLAGWVVSAVMVLLIPLRVSAQTAIATIRDPAPAEAATLTLEQALTEANQNSPVLRAARTAVLFPQAELAQAKRFNNPFIAAGLLPGLNAGTGAAVSVGKRFEVAGQRRYRTAAATARIKASEWQASDAERRLRVQVGQSFYAVRVQQDLIAVLDSVVAVVERLREAADLKLSGGFAPELDRNLALVQLVQARLQRDQAKSELVARKAELNALLGRSAEREFSTTGALVYEHIPDSLDLAELQAQARDLRPDIRAANAQLQVVAAVSGLARKLRVPDLVLGAGFTRDADGLETVGLNVGISLPVFDRNQRGRDVARAGEILAQAEAEATSLAVSREVKAAFSRLEAARVGLSTYQTNILALVDSNQRFASEAYARGELDITTTLLAQRQFAEAWVGYLEAVLGFDRSALELEGTVGVPLDGRGTGRGKEDGR